MSSKFCSECGGPLEEGSLFCGECGNKVGVPQPFQPPTVPGNGQQNSFKAFSKEITDDTYNVHSKRAGYGMGIVVVLMILAVIGYFVIRMLK